MLSELYLRDLVCGMIKGFPLGGMIGLIACYGPDSAGRRVGCGDDLQRGDGDHGGYRV